MCVYQMLLIERTLLVVYHSVALLREPSIAIGKRSHSPGHRSSSHDQWPLFDKVRIVKPFRSTVNLAAAYKLIIFSSFRAAYIWFLYIMERCRMTLSLSWATFFWPNPLFTFYSIQHHVHIRHRRDHDEKKAVVVVCVNIITRVMNKRETC